MKSSLSWTPWFDLQRRDEAPDQPGIYCIRRVDQDVVDYIGQTGTGTMTLRKRLAMLAGVYGSVMPYRDPHTAGPGLWALRHRDACDFEASVAVVTGSTADRKALEAVVISQYRQAMKQSPTVNFGRMPAGYVMSSANNATLKKAGRVFRGKPSPDASPAHVPGIAPVTGDLLTPLNDPAWGGHPWTAWKPVHAAWVVDVDAIGLYRLRAVGAAAWLYIGEGRIRDRLAAHVRKAQKRDTEQGRIFADAGPLEASWVVNNAWLDHQRLELENDLIAAHVLVVGKRPAGQFIG